MSDSDDATPRGDEKSLKFARGPRTTTTLAYRDGEEAATVRVDDEKEIEEFDQLALLTADGRRFGTATVTYVRETFAWQAFAAIMERGAVYGSQSGMHLMSALNDHYKETVWPSTRVKVVFFEVEEMQSVGSSREELIDA